MYSLELPRSVTYRCGRQVGKSENLSASRILLSAVRKQYSTLFICPRFEQARRLSVDKVEPLIRNSPYKHLLVDKDCTQNVQYRVLRNGNKLMFGFAFLDAERNRGISSNALVIDEAQDVNVDFIPILQQCMAGSLIHKDNLISGTPKSLNGTLEHFFNESSQGHWAAKCSCGKWNIASPEEQLFGIIQEHGAACAFCNRRIDFRRGQWVHRYLNRIEEHLGFHVSQVTHALHYLIPKNWQLLLKYRDTYTKGKFYNEILGIPHDSEEMLISLSAIRDISLSDYKNDLPTAIKRAAGLSMITFGIDWTGYGSDSSKSYTSLVCTGVNTQGDLEVIYMKRFSKGLAPKDQAAEIHRLFCQFRPEVIVHDGCGAGVLQEQFLRDTGIPAQRVIGMNYVYAPRANVLSPVDSTSQRSGYNLDKTRSLVLFFEMMKNKKVKLPEFESAKDFTDDFLNVFLESKESGRGSDVTTVQRMVNKSDDCCHATNYAATSTWYRQGRYPELTEEKV